MITLQILNLLEKQIKSKKYTECLITVGMLKGLIFKEVIGELLE